MKSQFYRAAPALALVAIVYPLRAQTEPSSTVARKPEDKTHYLFMGADVGVERGRKVYSLADVAQGSWVIQVNGRAEKVRPDRGDVRLKVSQALKLSTRSASLTGFRTERAFSPGRDPEMRRFREAASLSGYYADLRSLAAGRVADMANQMGTAIYVNELSKRLTGSSEGMNAGEIARTGRELAANFQNLDSTLGQQFLDQQLSRPTEGREDFDAVRIAFQVSSDQPLIDPYVVIVSRYREADAASAPVRNWVYAKALSPVTAKAQKVEIREAGFPPGFVLESTQLHLYDGGVEIATDVSPKRVALTADEAFQYSVLEYVGGHRKATLPAAPFMGSLPPPSARRSTDVFFVRVSREGFPQGIFADETCTRPVADEEVVRWANELRFKPALKSGKPIDSVLRLKPSSFRR